MSITETNTLNKQDMREFNLEEAKAGKKVCTRQGDKARIICFDAEVVNNHCLIVLVREWTGHESVHSYPKDGRATPHHITLGDLMMEE